MEKRGISAIVGMVLIILITVAVVAILWAAVIPLINTQLQLAEDCRKASTAIKLEETCTTIYNLTFVVVRKSGEFDLADIQFGASNTKRSVARYFVNQLGFNGSLIPGQNEKRYFSWDIGHDAARSTGRLSVAPVVRYKNKEKTCDPLPYVEVPWCNKTLNEQFPKTLFID